MKPPAYSKSLDTDFARRNGILLWIGSREALALAAARRRAGFGNCLAVVDTDPDDCDFGCLFGLDVTILDTMEIEGMRDYVVALLRAGACAVAVLNINGVVTDDNGNALIVER